MHEKLVQLNKTFLKNDKEVDIDTDYLIKQEEEEIKKLKQEIKKSKPPFEPITKKPEDFEPDIFIAVIEGKLSSIQYLIYNTFSPETKTPLLQSIKIDLIPSFNILSRPITSRCLVAQRLMYFEMHHKAITVHKAVT